MDAEIACRASYTDFYTDIYRKAHGSYGCIYYARKKGTNDLVAIKELPIYDEQRNNEQQKILQEIEIMRTAQHENCVKLYEYFFKDKMVWIVMELCLESVHDIMKDRDHPYTEPETSAILNGVLKGLSFLHSKNIIHRDIKSPNILLSEEAIIKIADFGISSNNNAAVTFIGSPYWMAPEIIISNEVDYYTNKVDIWSLGILTVEMMKEHPPYFNLIGYAVMHAIITNPPSDYSSDDSLSTEIKDFLSKCLVKEPKDRLSCNQLLNCEFISIYKGDERKTLQAICKETKERNSSTNMETSLMKSEIILMSKDNLSSERSSFSESEDFTKPYVEIDINSREKTDQVIEWEMIIDKLHHELSVGNDSSNIKEFSSWKNTTINSLSYKTYVRDRTIKESARDCRVAEENKVKLFAQTNLKSNEKIKKYYRICNSLNEKITKLLLKQDSDRSHLKQSLATKVKSTLKLFEEEMKVLQTENRKIMLRHLHKWMLTEKKASTKLNNFTSKMSWYTDINANIDINITKKLQLSPTTSNLLDNYSCDMDKFCNCLRMKNKEDYSSGYIPVFKALFNQIHYSMLKIKQLLEIENLKKEMRLLKSQREILHHIMKQNMGVIRYYNEQSARLLYEHKRSNLLQRNSAELDVLRTIYSERLYIREKLLTERLKELKRSKEKASKLRFNLLKECVTEYKDKVKFINISEGDNFAAQLNKLEDEKKEKLAKIYDWTARLKEKYSSEKRAITKALDAEYHVLDSLESYLSPSILLHEQRLKNLHDLFLIKLKRLEENSINIERSLMLKINLEKDHLHNVRKRMLDDLLNLHTNQIMEYLKFTEQ